MKELKCDGVENCAHPITMIDRKGFIYCTDHGHVRRWSTPCRKLRAHELNRLKAGKPIKKY